VARTPEVEVSVPPGRSGRRPGFQVHRVPLAESDVVQRFGIAVTSPGRTLLDLATRVPARVLERCVDDALRGRHATADELISRLRQDDSRYGKGASTVIRLLEVRVSSGLADSAGVDMVHRWIIRAGLPLPVLGLAVVVAGRPRRLDLAYSVEKIAIEFNGWEYHQMRSRMDADHARTTELELAGWLVIVVTAAHGESDTVDRISRALASRTTQAGGPDRSASWSGMLGR
jgi:hypothetical protein